MFFIEYKQGKIKEVIEELLKKYSLISIDLTGFFLLQRSSIKLNVKQLECIEKLFVELKNFR